MEIYQAEIDDGLSDLIKSTAAIAYSIEPKIVERAKAEQFIHKPNSNQVDLFYLEALLVSTDWNNNDDVFSINQTWAARNTPVDKQVNLMHNEKEIIGHITYSRAVDPKGILIADDTKEEDLTSFDIVVGSVIYKSWQDPEYKEKIEKLIAEIQEGKWFVSMECLFSAFDYAVITPTGDQKVIARNKDSAFLTKYLRSYGGTGVYKDTTGEYKLGRLLKNFIFSGKGIVDNPANKRSTINSFSFDGQFATAKSLFKRCVMELTKEQYDEVVLAKANAEKTVAEVKTELAQATQKNNELTSEVAKLNQDVANLKALSEEKTSRISALESEVKVSTEKVEASEAELKKIQSEIKAQARINKLVSVGVESAKAQEVVNKFASASEEMFDEVVELNKAAVNKEKEKSKEDMKEGETEMAKCSESSKASSVDLDKLADEAKASQAPSQENVDPAKATFTKASAWISSLISKTKE